MFPRLSMLRNISPKRVLTMLYGAILVFGTLTLHHVAGAQSSSPYVRPAELINPLYNTRSSSSTSSAGTSSSSTSSSSSSRSSRWEGQERSGAPAPTPAREIVLTADGPTEAAPGSTLTYTLTIKNNTSAAKTLTVVDQFTYRAIFVSASNGGTYKKAASVREKETVTWQNVTVPANGSTTLTVTVRSLEQASHNTMVIHTFTVGALKENVMTRISRMIGKPQPVTGCINVYALFLNQDGVWTFAPSDAKVSLDGSKTAEFRRDGHATFSGVTPGVHTLTQTLPSGWTQLMGPKNGKVTIKASTECGNVTFKNQK